MNQKICISKKKTYIGLLVFFLFVFVLLSALALQSNHANNSRADEIKTNVKSSFPTPPPPTDHQQSQALIYSALIDSKGRIEFLGDIPTISGSPTYVVYLKRPDGSFVYVDTFTASDEIVKNKFTNFWIPQNRLSPDDIKTSTFLLYRAD